MNVSNVEFNLWIIKGMMADEAAVGEDAVVTEESAMEDLII